MISDMDTQETITCFNPKIIKESKDMVIMEEGCLSIPKQFADIERPERIRFKYINEKNQIIEKNATGNESRVIQHEIDHLNGITMFDRAVDKELFNV